MANVAVYSFGTWGEVTGVLIDGAAYVPRPVPPALPHRLWREMQDAGTLPSLAAVAKPQSVIDAEAAQATARTDRDQVRAQAIAAIAAIDADRAALGAATLADTKLIIDRILVRLRAVIRFCATIND